MTSFGGKKVLITGAAAGIGRLMALEVSRRGATVVAWDIDEQRLGRLVEELEDGGAKAHAYVCDVGDRSAVRETADLVLAEAGTVDVLVNNAGIVSGRPFLDLTEEQIERTFEVNTLAHFWTTQAFLPAMVEQGSGHIVTIASAAGLLSTARQTDYAASKHAAVGFTESLRVELGSAPGLHVTLVCPNYIDTGMFEGVKLRFPWLTPILGQEDVAAAVVRAVESDRERLFMPPIVYVTGILRSVPARVSDTLVDWLGIAASMDHFVGHGGAR
jgi:all-trans-retinol dehydrogenase (NAD+)